jgi:lysozyme
MKRPKEMELSSKGFDVLHEREGLELEAYLDSTGVLTIGLGHTSAAGPPQVVQGMTITEDEAEEIFNNDCQRFRDEVIESVDADLTQHQFDACCSFLYNVGSANFLNSTFLARLNDGDMTGAAEALLWWDQPPEIITRRNGEHRQFVNAEYIARAETPA